MDQSAAVNWVLIVGVLMFPWAAAESPNCTVTQRPDGTFRYQLSEPLRSPRCSTCWEDADRTVMARDSVFNTSLVKNVTELYVDLKACQDHLRHTRECSEDGGETEDHVDCRVNCSLYLIQDPPPENRFCFYGDICTDRLMGGLFIGVPVAVIVLALVLWGSISIYRRRKSSYASPPEQSDVEMNPVDKNTALIEEVGRS